MSARTLLYVQFVTLNETLTKKLATSVRALLEDIVDSEEGGEKSLKRAITAQTIPIRYRKEIEAALNVHKTAAAVHTAVALSAVENLRKTLAGQASLKQFDSILKETLGNALNAVLLALQEVNDSMNK